MNYGLELMFPERKNIIVSKQEVGLEEKEKMPRNIAHSRVHATVTQKPIFFFSRVQKNLLGISFAIMENVPSLYIRVACYRLVPSDKNCHPQQGVHALRKCAHLYPPH